VPSPTLTTTHISRNARRTTAPGATTARPVASGPPFALQAVDRGLGIGIGVVASPHGRRPREPSPRLPVGGPSARRAGGTRGRRSIAHSSTWICGCDAGGSEASVADGSMRRS
jgi:hypothetical protein